MISTYHEVSIRQLVEALREAHYSLSLEFGEMLVDENSYHQNYPCDVCSLLRKFEWTCEGCGKRSHPGTNLPEGWTIGTGIVCEICSGPADVEVAD